MIRKFVLCFTQTLCDQLPGQVDIGFFLKYNRDLRQPIVAQRAGTLEAWEARHGGLNRIGNLLLNLWCREPVGSGIDLNLDIRYVRYCVDR